MIMDVKDTDSDLHALRRLYGLLKRDGEGTSHMLDDRARLLLKNLLDEATKRVLKIPPSDEDQPSTLPKLSKKAEGTQSEDIRKEKRLEQTKSMESVVVSGRKKRCRVCQRDTVKQLESIEETQFYDAVQNPDIFSDKQNDESDHYLWNNQQKTGSCSGSLLSSNNNKMVAAKAYNSNPDIQGMSEEVNCLAEEASKAINIGADDHHLQNVNKFHGQNVIVDNFEPGNWILSQNIFLPSRFHNVQDFSFPAIYSPASKIGSSYESSKWDRYKNHRSKIMRKTKLDEKTSRILAGSRFQENGGIPNTRQYITAPRMTCLQQQESEGTATDSNSSYSRSQQARSGDSDNDSDSDSQEYSFSSMSSENVYSSYTSNSGGDDEVYSSSTSGEPAREVTSRSSSKSQEYSSANRIKRKIEGGVWSKLKDKLAIVFHHHHHHHHHHHNPNDKNTSSRKRKGKVFNSKRWEEAYGERVVEKTSKSLIREKNQQNHFHGLMEGLMRHVKHSKKSKRGKEAAGKKSLKKSHWWQLMQHHRGAKLPNKTQLKLGLDKKRTRLKALPRPK